MTTIQAVTLIHAPLATCFNVSLDIDAEAQAEQAYKIQAIAGVTHGIIGPNETVTWRVRQFGLWVKHTTLISAHEPPGYFQDRMVEGIFESFVHDHYFRSITERQTVMRDSLSFAMPLYLGGAIVDRLLIQRRLRTMLAKRNATIKRLAEASAGNLGADS